MDPGLGTTSVLFDLGSPTDGFGYSGLTSSNGQFFAVQEDSFGDSELVSFLPNGGGAYTSVLALTAANAPLFNGGLTYDTADGNFYAMGNFSVGASNFYRINVGTDTITKLFEVLGNGYLGGVTYNALDNSFYAIQDDSNGNSTLQHITVSGNVGHQTLLFSNFGVGFYGGLTFDATYTNLYALNADSTAFSSLNQVIAGAPTPLMGVGFGFLNAGLTLGPAPVPEPATFAPVLGGLILLSWILKRRMS